MSQLSFIFLDLDIFGAQASDFAKCPQLGSSAISPWFMLPVLVRNVTGCVLLVQCWSVPILVMLIHSKAPIRGPEGSGGLPVVTQQVRLLSSGTWQVLRKLQQSKNFPTALGHGPQWGPRAGEGQRCYGLHSPISRWPSCLQLLLSPSPSSRYSY